MNRVPNGQAMHYVQKPNPRSDCGQDTAVCPDGHDEWRRAACDRHVLRDLKTIARQQKLWKAGDVYDRSAEMVMDVDSLKHGDVVVIRWFANQDLTIDIVSEEGPDLRQACLGRKVFKVGNVKSLADSGRLSL